MSERVAFVFPGQGSQTVGMGADIYASSPAARRVFEIADATLGFSISAICFSGPEDTLRETINTQPALVATSLALLAALQEAAGASFDPASDPALASPLTPEFTLGHSVGEYAALAAAGSLNIEDAVRLVRERGRLMHQEGLACPSGMAAVLGMDAATLEGICEEATAETLAQQASGAHPGAGRVVVANDNAPGQIVISGASDALERAMQLARERGARRVVPLVVSGAFHSPVMLPASQAMARVVQSVEFSEARVPVISNIAATPMRTSDEIRTELAHQIDSPVQWTRSIEYLASQGITHFVEIGSGQVLSGLIKRIVKGSATLSVATASDVAVAAGQIRDWMAS